MSNLDLCYLSATEALKLFKSRQLSPIELAQAVIQRAETIAPTVNPFADRYFDQAMDRARRAETKYTRANGRARRLEGIPLAIKDSSPVRGTRATNGSFINKDCIDDKSDPSVERLLRAGANFFVRTTCPEFCWLFACHSRMWGVTRNPWRLDITPGGSSGGSAAALAAGATTLATGTDSTGSIRQPASQCGVVGYKAPYGRNPLGANSSFDPYVHVGPMTRTVADAVLMQNIMSGPHPLDHNSLRQKIKIPDELKDITGLKLAFSMDLGHYEVVGDVRRETLSALDTLRGAGANVIEVPADWASKAIRLAHASEEFLFAKLLNDAIRDH
ncbi:MAG: amidase, partial [Gammaproteobacteria bacterium]|nr:amidase [Gammaproteobacteria bacterium]